jgi:hypothetical protein
MSVAADVELQRRLDAERGGQQAALLARMRAVIGAQRALAAGELGAREALRQSLVDVAAAAELLAEDLELAEGWSNVREAAGYLGVPVRRIHILVNARKLHPRPRLGTTLAISRRELDALQQHAKR